MSKHKTPSTADHDDIAGLFQRLDGRGDNGGYRDFSDSQLQTPVSGPSRREPAAAPPPLPVAAAPASPAAPEAPLVATPTAAEVVEPVLEKPAVPVIASVVRIEAKDAAGKPAAKTSLDRLFQRLADAPLPADRSDDSPLSRFRAS